MSDDAAIVRAEWRAEEEQWSRAAFERWEHGRDLADVARDCMHRGDAVTFTFSSTAFAGVFVAVGDDIARVDTGDLRVDVRLAADCRFVLRTRPGRGAGHRGDGAVTTFLARLRELDGTAVCIGVFDGSVEGELRVGRDQVRITAAEGGVAYVPTGSLDWVHPLDAD